MTSMTWDPGVSGARPIGKLLSSMISLGPAIIARPMASNLLPPPESATFWRIRSLREQVIDPAMRWSMRAVSRPSSRPVLEVLGTVRREKTVGPRAPGSPPTTDYGVARVMSRPKALDASRLERTTPEMVETVDLPARCCRGRETIRRPHRGEVELSSHLP